MKYSYIDRFIPSLSITGTDITIEKCLCLCVWNCTGRTSKRWWKYSNTRLEFKHYVILLSGQKVRNFRVSASIISDVWEASPDATATWNGLVTGIGKKYRRPVDWGRKSEFPRDQWTVYKGGFQLQNDYCIRVRTSLSLFLSHSLSPTQSLPVCTYVCML